MRKGIRLTAKSYAIHFIFHQIPEKDIGIFHPECPVSEFDGSELACDSYFLQSWTLLFDFSTRQDFSPKIVPNLGHSDL